MAVTDHMSEADADSEVTSLLRMLDGQRRHVLGILDGLDDDALRRPVLPSGWNCLGLVQHLALDVERFWFRGVVAGYEEIIRDLPTGDEAWNVGPETTAAAVLDGYRQETAAADAVITASPPTPSWPGGPTTCSANHTCTPCATSCCTSSPRRHATPATSTRHAS